MQRTETMVDRLLTSLYHSSSCAAPFQSLIFDVIAMIKEKNLSSWKELMNEIDFLLDGLGEKSEEVIYRGQSDSTWGLRTTAERELRAPITLSRYYRFAFTAKHQFETLIGNEWEIDKPVDYDKWLSIKEALYFDDFPAYDYFAYLRHHGFPSPFLDWTSSPYVAAFFALVGQKCSEKRVSVFCYLERASSWKLRSSERPGIYILGPYVKTHKRHVLQQSQYSFCVQLDDEGNPIYGNHEEVLEKEDKHQDRLWKFNIPASERVTGLRELNKMNINSYSLFGTEDALAKTIAVNEIIKNAL